jgi:hypothetical protein
MFLTVRTKVPDAEDKVADAEDKVPNAEDKVLGPGPGIGSPANICIQLKMS